MADSDGKGSLELMAAIPELVKEMIYVLDVDGPLSTERRQFWQMARATLEGPRVRAATILPGIDWFTPVGDGYGHPHVRLPFRTDDGAIVLMEYRGIVHATDAFQRAVAEDTPTKWEDQYMRMALTFSTDAAPYAWLTKSLFVARGRLLGAKKLEYEVFRIT
jgi:hypothetical protein